MKRTVLAAWLVSVASAAQAACVSVEEGLAVLSNPSADGAVWGSIRGGQCGVEITALCRAPYCFVFSGGLAGWVDARSLSAEAHESVVQSMRYSVDGVVGTASAMGREQPLTFEIGSELAFDLTVWPPRVELPNNALPSTNVLPEGGDLFAARVDSFFGLPMQTIIEFEQLGAERAVANLRAEGPLTTMEGQLKLVRLGGPTRSLPPDSAAPFQGGVSVRPDDRQAGAPAAADDEVRTQDRRQVREPGADEQSEAVARSVPSPQPSPTNAAACTELSAQIRPILRGSDNQQRELLMQVMLSEGIVTISNQDDATCELLSVRFAQAGLIPEAL
ncbi:MAG: hypothetical protein AAF580_03470 [Pseudomonadota bacterium]